MLSPSPCSAMSRRVEPASRAGIKSVRSWSISATAYPARPLFRVALVVMPLQYVVAEIVGKAAINRVRVIGVVLRVIVLDEERRPFNTVVMRFAAFRAAGPREMDFIEGSFVNRFEFLAGFILAITVNVFLDHFPKQFL